MIFARAATDAKFGVYGRTHMLFLVAYHFNSPGGTVAGAVAARLSEGGGDAFFEVDACRADFGDGFLLYADWFKCSGRTNVATSCTFGATEAFGELKYRLHEAVSVN